MHDAAALHAFTDTRFCATPTAPSPLISWLIYDCITPYTAEFVTVRCTHTPVTKLRARSMQFLVSQKVKGTHILITMTVVTFDG